LSIVNPPARLAMQRIREKPRVETFLTESRKFGQKTGFETPEVTSLIDLMVGAGAVGAAQNMIGKAVHGVVADEKALRASRLIKKRFPKAMVFVSQLDDRGVRIVRD
jgi:pantoate kinase